MAEPQFESQRLSEAAKQEADLRKHYVGKRVSLVGPQLLWGAGPLHLNRMNPERKDAHTNVVPENMSFNDLNSLHQAVQRGMVAFTDGLNSQQRESFLTTKEEPVNDPQFVESMEDIDDLLHTSPDKLEEKLRSLEANKRLTKDFFTRLLEEEKGSKNRKEYLDVIQRFQL